MTATTTDFAALCAAIDAGDDSALPALADALEEAGDELASGLRFACAYQPYAQFFWLNASAASEAERITDAPQAWVPGEIFSRLAGALDIGHSNTRGYLSRSAAFLALAAALAQE